MYRKFIRFFLENRLITLALLIGIIFYGLIVSPFSWGGDYLPKDPIRVDAIPNIGPNQQIVSTEWPGRSPQDIQDQVTYPLTTLLMGVPGVESIRSSSMFGVSFIYIIFEDNIDFYWSRSRILESLNSIPNNTLPTNVKPQLGPDATALGMVYWYTLVGKDPKTGAYVGGWSPQELRTIQDFFLKYQLESVNGIAQVASVGGYTKEYQIDINPDILRTYGITLQQVADAVKSSNLDIGVQTIEINRVEYIVRGLGYIKNLDDLRKSVISIKNGEPIRIEDVAFVTFGPAPRRGGLDVEGEDAVGAAVITRFDVNPQEAISKLKEKITQLMLTMPEKRINDSVVSRVSIEPFYDRSLLIGETIQTLEVALTHEMLISIIVIIVLVLNLKASIIISGLLPIGVLATFILMQLANVEANIVALSGIAIAIGVMVDIGIVLTENIVRHLEKEKQSKIHGNNLLLLIHDAVIEVSPAIITAMLTTIVSFLPVFGLQEAEGKMFHPLAYTKSFALICALILSLVILPTLAYYLFSFRVRNKRMIWIWNSILIISGILLSIRFSPLPVISLTIIGLSNLLFLTHPSENHKSLQRYITILIILFALSYLLAKLWLPLGPVHSLLTNFLFVFLTITFIMAALWMIIYRYKSILIWCLNHKAFFLSIPMFFFLVGITAWLGWNTLFAPFAETMRLIGIKEPEQMRWWQQMAHRFPGLGQEFMPTLDEGSFLLMPSSMPTSGVTQNQDYISLIDEQIATIPEIASVVGKWGRINSALDPAPIQMYEITINYRSEYLSNIKGTPIRFKVTKNSDFILTDGTTYNPQKQFRIIPADSLIPDRHGNYFRQWRDSIRNRYDLWHEILRCATLPGLTTPPMLQPIQTRLMMLSTGMTSTMGLKVYGSTIEDVEKGGILLEQALKQIPQINHATVYYDPILGAPYLQIILEREAMARYGLSVNQVQQALSVAIGGIPLTRTVEGREGFDVRVRYPRELRNNAREIGKVLIATPQGVHIPLDEVASLTYVNGAKTIKSENSFPVGYIIFDQHKGIASIDAINAAQTYLSRAITNGTLQLPKGVSYEFAGSYQDELRATHRFALLVPLTLILIFLILYLKFRNIVAASIVFSGVFVAFSGGFILLWLYGQPWFLDIMPGGVSMRTLFQIHPINISVAVWVGFVALFGISTDDGVLMGTYIDEVVKARNPQSIAELHQAVIEAGLKRVRPAVMTTACAIIALLPILSSHGKGSTLMIPMAIPLMGGMIIQVMTMFIVPVCQSIWREREIRKRQRISTSIETYHGN